MKKLSALGCFLIVLLGLAGGLVYLDAQIPDVAEQMPPNASPILVTLTLPPNDATIPLNDATPISVDAIAPQPIVAVELWVNGVRLFSKTSDAGLKQFTAVWSWTPASEGTHTLMARAMDAQQREGQSNVVRVVASQAANSTTALAYKSQSGDTVPIIAQKFKVPPQQVIDANPQINPNNPIPAGQQVLVPVPDASEPGQGVDNSIPEPPSSNPPAPDPGQGAPAGPPNKWGFWIKALAHLFSPSNPPAKPELSAVVEGCNIKLTITDHALNEDGFYVHRDGANPALKPIATLGEKSGTGAFSYTDVKLAQGTYVYSVEVFNPAGSTLSNPVQVKITDSQCAPSIDWSKFIQVFKLKTKQSVDKVYCYLKINDGAWNRIPHAPNTFLSPNAQGVFDVEAYLKSLPIVTLQNKLTLELDCWGWKGNQLIYLGNAKETVSGQVQMIANQFEVTAAIPPMIDLGKIPGVQGVTPGAQNFFGEEVPAILPPGKLKNTSDPKECAAHMPGPVAVLGGAFTCQAATSSGNYAVLVWEWLGGCWPGQTTCVPKVDGYRVYRENFPTPTLVKQVKGEGFKVAMFPLPPQPWALEPNASVWTKAKYAALSKNCYLVRAYKDGVGESPDSQKICLPFDSGISNAKTIQIPASAWLTRFVYKEECNMFQGPSDKHGLATSAGDKEIEVGYHYTTEGCNLAWVARGAMWFDLSSVPANGWLDKAILRYTLVKTNYSGNVATNMHRSCANRLMLGKAVWMGKNFGDEKYWIPGEPYQNLPTEVSSLDLAVDVTSAVQEWMQGTRPNYGFVFRQSQEGMHTDWDSKCTSLYKNFRLDVTFTPKK